MLEYNLILERKKNDMKYVLGILASILMIWSLLDKENNEYKVYVQVVAVALFFYIMMRLMNKTPSKNDNSKNDADLNNENNDERLE